MEKENWKVVVEVREELKSPKPVLLHLAGKEGVHIFRSSRAKQV